MSLKGVNDFSHEDYKEMRFLVEETKKGNKDAATKLYKFVEMEIITPSAYERLINEYADVVYVKEKNDYKPLILTLLIVLVICGVFIYNAFAHQGRTDSSGGHKDNSNKSGLGSYHYHCGGHPAHLHDNGYCPYESTSSHSDYDDSDLIDYEDSYDYGYEKGYDAGYDDGYNDGERNGYETGYDDGYYEEQEKYQQLFDENENLIKKNDKLKEEKSNFTVFIVVLIIIILILFFNRKKE